jgi:hypothetical protein
MTVFLSKIFFGMKLIFFLLAAFVASAFISVPNIKDEEVELICVKTHKATNTCYYNFKIGGIKYNYIDNGCKGKRDAILKKANEGKLALAKEWKIPCPEPKKKPDTN